MIEKIISGGQTGADFGGLEAGKILGIQTGGTAPNGYRTELGSNLLLKDFGLIEHKSSNYYYRTIENVKNSSGTIWFGNSNSPGGKLTISTCNRLRKSYSINPDIQQFIKWIKCNNIQILNVAGNRESTNPGIEQYVKEFLVNSIKLIIGDNNE